MQSLADLTPEAIAALNADEVTNALVAEAVGWPAGLRIYSNYSTDLAAAADATDAMARETQRGWRINYDPDEGDDAYECTIWVYAGCGCVIAYAPTEALARCKAVLLAWLATREETTHAH